MFKLLNLDIEKMVKENLYRILPSSEILINRYYKLVDHLLLLNLPYKVHLTKTIFKYLTVITIKTNTNFVKNLLLDTR